MRVKKGSARNRANKRIFHRASGYVLGRSRLLRTMKETLARAGAFAYRDRRVKKREFRNLWVIRVNAACRARGLRYSQFISGLAKANIKLDRKSLSEIAIDDPTTFDAIVAEAKTALGV